MAALRSFGRFLLQREYARCYGLITSRSLNFGQGPLHTPGGDDCDNLVAITSNQPEAISWESVRNRAVLRLISAHGLTIAEALAIDREHLCFAERTLSVGGRSHRRTLLLETEVVQDILAYLEACPYEIENGSPLFRGTRGARLVPRVVQLTTKTLRSQLGLHEEVTPRAIRKDRVLQLLASGARDYDIMQQVGISASAMGSILREAPRNPLEVRKPSAGRTRSWRAFVRGEPTTTKRNIGALSSQTQKTTYQSRKSSEANDRSADKQAT
jgi:integrase/recombinase XerC